VLEVSDRSGSVMIRSDMPDAAKDSLQYFLKSLQVITSNFFGHYTELPTIHFDEN
jgi:hypothetical protein